MRLPAFVCLSVCLSVSKITQKGVRGILHEMLRVDRCRDMDELINFCARSGLQSGCWNRIAFSDIVCAATRNFIRLRRENPTYRYWAASTRGFTMVLLPRAVGTTLSEAHALYRVPFFFQLHLYLEFLSRVSILTRDIDIANLSVRPSVTFRYQMKTA